MRATEPLRKSSDDAFAFSFIAAVASYSVFSTWFSLVPGLLAFIGGFLLSFGTMVSIRFLEQRRLREAKRADELNTLFRHVERSNTGKSA